MTRAEFSAQPVAPDADPFDELGAAYSRRRMFTLLGGGAVAAIGAGMVVSHWSSVGATSTPVDPAVCAVIPEETGGPYPGDGSNGPNVLDDDGIVRSDITASYGTSTTVAEGVPLTIELLIVDTASGCTPMPGAAVYLWHCDREGRYSLYSDGVENENYLRGVWTADDEGVVTFTSIFPACYSGRWPHAHFEIFPTVEDAVAGTNRVATSQLALPADVCDVVFATEGYEDSVRNFSGMSLETDNVFSDDGAAQQLVTVTGSVEEGYVARLTVPV